MRTEKFFNLLFGVAIFINVTSVSAQTAKRNFFTPADSLNVRRLALVSGSWAAMYASAMVGLDQAWYNQHERVGFHSFNDWPEWHQMDKAGHVWTAYVESRWTAQALKWSGVKPGVADVVGVGTAMLFQTTLEMFDAYSAKWGFSWSDVGANAVGAGVFYAQEKLWDEQRVAIKFSSHLVTYRDELADNFSTEAYYRARDLYGETFAERMLKDYNGQTYWLSVNPSSFSRSDFKPRWLSIAIGYGAGGMLGGRDNVWIGGDGALVTYEHVPRTRQFFLSPDIDFTRIRTHSPLLKTLFEIASAIKVPAPALIIDDNGAAKFVPIQF